LFFETISLINFAYPTPEKNSLCYYNSNAVYRPAGGQMLPENIYHDCHYLIYAYVGVDIVGEVLVLDPVRDILNGEAQINSPCPCVTSRSMAPLVI